MSGGFRLALCGIAAAALVWCAQPANAAPEAKPRFSRDRLIQKAYEHFYNVEYPEAAALFQQDVDAAPEDAERHNRLAEALLFGMMNRAGALEVQMVTGADAFNRRAKMEPDPHEQALFTSSIQKALELTQHALDKNPDDADALYERGVAIAYRGVYNYMVKKSWIDSLRDATEARRLHNRVFELDSSRFDARLVQGVHDYTVGSLPFFYKMLGFLAGFHGDKEEGLRTLRQVAAKGVRMKVEAEFVLCVAYRRERRPVDAIPLLESLHKRFPRNFLVLLELSQMYATLGDRSKTLAPLEQIEKLKRSGAPGLAVLPEERVQFARGSFLFWHKEFDPAIHELEQATARPALDLNSGPEAWLRLGQCYDIKGRRSDALRAYEQSVAIAANSDPAKEARKYIDSAFTREKLREIQRETKLPQP